MTANNLLDLLLGAVMVLPLFVLTLVAIRVMSRLGRKL